MVHAHFEHADIARRAASGPGSAARRHGCCSSSPSGARGPAPTRSSAANSASLVPVLPTEPVTPMILRLAALARRPGEVVERDRRVGDADMRDGRRPARPARPRRPAAKAWSTKRWPSVASPFSAMNRSPGPTSRRIERRAGDVEIAMRRRRRRSPRRSLGRCPERAHAASSRATVTSSNGQHPVADDLALLVALAGEEDDVAGAGLARSRRGSPRGGRRSRSRPARRRGSRARIAAGSSLRGLSSVTITRSASRAAASPISARLPRVAVAAGAEDDDQPVLGMRPSASIAASIASGVWA